MPTTHAWLDDVRPSPYADQFEAGFYRLRFVPHIEREYRDYMLGSTYSFKRIALYSSVLLWLVFTAFDFVLVQGPVIWWMFSVRLAVLALLLGFVGLLIQQRHAHLLQPLTLVSILALGIGAAMVIGLAHTSQPTYPYEGLLLICMAAYFLIGLRLKQAVACSLAILLVYVGMEWLAGVLLPRLLSNTLFLLIGNLMGATGCYLLEFKSREHFLVSRLMRVLADHDSLTGLHNRRSFNRQFERLWRQAQREGHNLALLLCDIDHFKAYNDCYGHQAGDKVLECVGGLLRMAARRPLDMAVRLGGEEFAVLLYDSEVSQALEYAEALRESLQQLAIEHRASDTAPVVTMSIGVACLQPDDASSLSKLYEGADRALYKAKAAGRNQVMN
nr:GGDEF domain-containing protein [uncultured Pseudomonas sp.]